jgi:glycosyltransferase involved in cell wall biosynthesis
MLNLRTRNPISVLLPVKNGLIYLPELEKYFTSNLSLEDQIIIVNDGSTDGSAEYLSNWAKKSTNMSLINTKGEGLIACLNIGIKESHHKWIARFDVDDSYPDQRLDHQSQVASGETVAVFSDYTFVNGAGEYYGKIASPVYPTPTVISLANNLRTAHPSVLFSKEAVVEVGGYRASDYLAEDLSLWLRLSRIGNLVSVPKNLLNYRLTSSSITSQNRNKVIAKKAEILKIFQFNSSHFFMCLDNLEQIFDQYDQVDLGCARKILLLNDLFAASRTMEKSISSRKKLIQASLKLFNKPYAYSQLCGLYIEKKRREKLRSEFLHLIKD